MSLKRAFGIDPANVVEGARGVKKRKEQTADSNLSHDMETQDPGKTEQDSGIDLERVRSDGLKIWNALKDAKGVE